MPPAAEEFFSYVYWVWWIVDHEKYQEIEGIVEAIDSDVITVSRTVMINSLYELQAWCTSIIAQTKEGSIIHARNLDFDFADYMRTITYRAVFTRGGKTLYEADMFAGCLGVYTAIKPGAYSISQN